MTKKLMVWKPNEDTSKITIGELEMEKKIPLEYVLEINQETGSLILKYFYRYEYWDVKILPKEENRKKGRKKLNQVIETEVHHGAEVTVDTELKSYKKSEIRDDIIQAIDGLPEPGTGIWENTKYFDEVLAGKADIYFNSTDINPRFYKYFNKWLRCENMLCRNVKDKDEYVKYLLSRATYRNFATGNRQWYMIGNYKGNYEYLKSINKYLRVMDDIVYSHVVTPEIIIEKRNDDIFITVESPLYKFDLDKQKAKEHIAKNMKHFINYAIECIEDKTDFKHLGIPINMFEIYDMTITIDCSLFMRFCLKKKLREILEPEE